MGHVELNTNAYTTFARATIFLPPQVKGLIILGKWAFEEFLAWSARPCELFMRRRFGVRSLSVFQTCQIANTGLAIGVLFLRIEPAFAAFGFCAAVLAVFHRWEAYRWEKYGSSPRFSYSNGEHSPLWLPLGRGLQILRLDPARILTGPILCFVCEPLLCLIVAGAVWKLSPTLSTYLFSCAVALVLKTYIIHSRMVSMKRDAIDARILSQRLIGLHQSAAGTGEQSCYIVSLATVPVPENTANQEPVATPTVEPVANTEAKRFIILSCGKCSNPIYIRPKHVGKSGWCRKCGHRITIRQKAKATA